MSTTLEHLMVLREAAQLGIDESNASAITGLAVGRILRLGSRPTQPGDVEQYEACRRIILICSEVLGIRPKDTAPNYVRDRNGGH